MFWYTYLHIFLELIFFASGFQKMTFMKAYEELWNSRFMNQPIKVLSTLTMEVLKEEVTRCWKIERNLNHDHPISFRYHHLPNTGALSYPIRDLPHIIKGKYLFNHVDQQLYCHIYSPEGLLKCIWCSDPIPNAGGYWIRSSVYYENGAEILVIITLGLSQDVVNQPSSPLVYLRQHRLDVDTSLPSDNRGLSDIQREWAALINFTSTDTFLHNCRDNTTLKVQCPVKEPHSCHLPGRNIFFAGERLLFCLWIHDIWDTETRAWVISRTLSLYLIPFGGQRIDGGSGTLIARGSKDIDSPITIHKSIMRTQDAPDAEDIEKCLQDRSNETIYTFHFITLLPDGSDSEIFSVQILSVQVSSDIGTSSLQIQTHTRSVETVYSPNHAAHLVLNVISGCDPITVGHSVTKFGTQCLLLYKMNNSKLLKFINTNSNDTGTLNKYLTDWFSWTNLGGKLINMWPSINSDVTKTRNVQFDVDSGRLFLVCTDGIRVIHYV